MKNLLLSFALVAVSPLGAVSCPEFVKRSARSVASVGKGAVNRVKAGGKSVWANKAIIAKVAAGLAVSGLAIYLADRGAQKLGYRGLAAVVSPRLAQARGYVASTRLVQAIGRCIPSRFVRA